MPTLILWPCTPLGQECWLVVPDPRSLVDRCTHR